MVYVRAKNVKGDHYLYLVKSVWDSKRSTSKQEIIKYLGKASKVLKEDIPLEYRDDPKILSVLSKYNPADIKKREEASKKSRKLLYKKLTEGDINSCIKIYEGYVKIFNSTDFFDKILKPVMYQIGDDWATSKISIATEHVASNVAQTLVRIVMDRINANISKNKVMICLPLGEEHHLGCDIIETFLTGKGFKVYNMGTSMPSESVLNFIGNNNPEIILISITLEDNLKAGQRLVKKIKDQFDIPVVVGGYALQNEKMPKFNAKIMANASLEDIPKVIRTVVN